MFPTLILVAFLSHFSYGEETDLGEVIFANVLYRHGDRTPIDTYPNDPYNNESLWPVPFGQLTNTGKNQHLELGRWLRKRYSHLLPELYSLHDIYIRSTDVDRTLMSAEANLAGLYPPHGDQIWNNISWMPIPVHTLPEKQDSLLAQKKYCARYEYELTKLKNSPEMKKMAEKNKELYEYVSEKSGTHIDDLESLNILYNVLFIEELYNRTLPEWTKSVYPDKLKPLAELSFALPAYNKILQRLKTGLLLGEMTEHFVKKSKSTLLPDRKLWIYSGHDTTIANLLMALNSFDLHCPSYAATLLMELRLNSKNQHIVTIWYKDSTDPILLTLPGCKAACPLTEFIKLTKDLIPEDWEQECSMGWDPRNTSISGTTIIVMLSSMALVLILLVFLIIGFVYWHQKNEFNRQYVKLSTDPI